MKFIYICGYLLFCVSAALLLGLTPRAAAEDLTRVMCPRKTLRRQSMEASGRARANGAGGALLRLRDSLRCSGREKTFDAACAFCVILPVCACALCALMDNFFLIPVLCPAAAVLPFAVAGATQASFERHSREEMETALSVITTSYIRTDDLVGAVEENLSCLRRPVADMFRSFLADATLINSSLRDAIRGLKEKSGDAVFREWCDTLLACQDDRTLKDTLLPVVAKLTDVRIVNSELGTLMAGVRREYLTMVLLVVSSVPILYAINRDWYAALVGTVPGKAVLALCAAVIFITAVLMSRYTRPVEYKR